MNRNIRERRQSAQGGTLIDNSVLTFPRAGRFFTSASLVVGAYTQTITASHEQATLEAWRAFSGSGHWATVTNLADKILTLDLGVNCIVKSYTIQNGTSASNYNLYSARSWTFEASANGSSWVTLDTVANSTDTTSSSVRTRNLSNNSAYRFYRFVFTAGNDATHTKYVITQQIALLAS